ncbi:MAG TPA: UbiA family prenyltransferase [Candidatus Saccharimonadia bacterium]|jgi:4-hydroxybenzoate polyprenyltransferase|nr:UbiA family prenyltransferase [Candidatus Saccharimonadia bacterium]
MVSQYLKSLRGLLRVPTYLLLSLNFLLGLLVAGGGVTTRWWLVAAGLVAVGGWYVHATSLNDLSDYAIDQINLKSDPDRPLVTGGMSRRVLVLTAGLATAVTLAAAYALGPRAVILAGLLLVLNIVYSLPPLRVAGRGALALVLLPVGYVAYTMTLGAVAAGGPLTAGFGQLVAVCYAQFVARVSLKDYRDVLGDAKFGKRTFLLRHGSNAVIALALSGHTLAGIGGLAWLYPRSPLLAAAYGFLAAAAGMLLWRLRAAKSWPRQRVWISAYGRLVTGQIVVLILAGLQIAGYLRPGIGQAAVAVLVLSAFAWSSQRVVEQLSTASAGA